MWSDFNEANSDAMLKSELISWPVTLAILVLAFGSLVAAGLPLMLTIVGLVASAGVLYLGTLISPISIWAMNFALMFALALGHRLRAVHRDALPQRPLRPAARTPVDAVATTMDTAGKAVLFSGLTVLISLSAVMLVPSPAFRSMSLGIMISVLFVLAATLTLLPAVLAKLGPRVDKPRPPLGPQRRAPLAALRALGRAALAPAAALRRPRADRPAGCWRCPVLSLQTGMPSIKVVPDGRLLAGRLRRRSPMPSARRARARCRWSHRPLRRAESRRCCAADPGIAAVMPAAAGPRRRWR